MTTTRFCCCEATTYQVLQPCFQEDVAEVVYMTESNHASCGFTIGQIYSWDTGVPADDPYCGYWQFTSNQPVGLRLVSDCSDFTLNSEGCCGGDCLPDTTCCGTSQCWDWFESQSKRLVALSGFSGGSGSTTGWSVSVSSVGVSSSGWVSGSYEYTVTVSLLIAVSGIGDLECNGQTSFTTGGSFSFTVTHDKIAGSPCVDTTLSSVSMTDPDCDIRICAGTTTVQATGNDFDDVSRVRPSMGGSPSVSNPDLGVDCLNTPAYSLAVPINYTLQAGSVAICGGDTSGLWPDDAFPDVNISATLTLTGNWG